MEILLVEDNPTLQQVILNMLKCGMGYRRVCLANNGVGALQEINERLLLSQQSPDDADSCLAPFDVILMDISMPIMDGFECTLTIRRTLSHTYCPYVLALSANAMDEDRQKALAIGMDSYLCKPLRRPQLEAALKDAYPEILRRRGHQPAALVDTIPPPKEGQG